MNSNKFGWGSAGISVKGDHFKTTMVAIEKTWKRFVENNIVIRPLNNMHIRPCNNI